MQEYYFRNLNFNSSSCDKLVYEVSVDSFRFEGSRGYDDTNSTLTIVYLYGLGDPYFPGTKYRVYEVSFSEYFLVLSIIDNTGLLIPKNE